MSQKNLGKIKKIDLNTVFNHEARNLTPWLAESENLKELGNALGIDIELIRIEEKVGRYSVDILAKNVDTDALIIIENQLYITDHDHLGKLITYASGHDAKHIIWIFGDITEEHQQAIEWLNDHIDDSIEFYAVKIQLWQIDDSKPAIMYDVIAAPNEWKKTLKKSANENMTDTKLAQLQFWESFQKWSEMSGYQYIARRPRPQQWYNVGIGTSAAHICLSVNTQNNTAACDLYIRDNKELFEFLRNHQDTIEKDLNIKLDWIEAKKDCRIKVYKPDFDITRTELYDEYYKWFIKNTTDFKRVFLPFIEDYNS